jgi:hypothetical protein
MASAPPQPPAEWLDPNLKSFDCGFEYEPLHHEKSFRLLKLLLSSDLASPIQFTLSEESMEESNKKYAAISYVWGNTQYKREITVNDRPAFVTHNLHSALCHLRGISGLLANILRPLPLWIDALCINQQDPNEKQHQVGYMRDIFANAQTVVAWLGPEADGSDVIMDAIKKDLIGADLAAIPRSALVSFFTRDWWTRVWICQELMVSRMLWILCGFSYENIYIMFGFLTNILRDLDKQSYYITDTKFRDLLSWRFHLIMLYSGWDEQESLPLLDLIELTHDAGASDPRDRVFALLGLVGPQENLQLTPDYKLSPCEVFCSAIRVMAKDTKRSAAVMKAITGWRPRSYAGLIEDHWPLREQVTGRELCDGITCSSRSLCLDLPGLAKPNAARVVQRFIMGLQDPETRQRMQQFEENLPNWNLSRPCSRYGLWS